MSEIPEKQHNIEIQENLECWKNKPTLREVYKNFYEQIKRNVNQDLSGEIVELGSGIGNLKSYIPNAICTDLFDNPWIDQKENAYELSFANESVSNLILFDVFHHLQHPGDALNEFKRVLTDNGRVIIFEPDISLLGRLVYGPLHNEPINYTSEIEWLAPKGTKLRDLPYYAAQGNANRIFVKKDYDESLIDWEIINTKRIAAMSYIGTGGYSRKQMYPHSLLPLALSMDNMLSKFPSMFSTRLLVVLKKIS